ncbi:MAG TPA: hypothetical protein VLR71_22350 [Casimicrobiaceae bacterium]|nr:hypothetical protein [Casimicrobiaceae bacterium]
MTRTRTGAAGDMPARRFGARAMRQSGSVLAASLQVGLAVFIALASIGLAGIATVMTPSPVPPVDIVAAMAHARQSAPSAPSAAPADAPVSAAARAGSPGAASPPAIRCREC